MSWVGRQSLALEVLNRWSSQRSSHGSQFLRSTPCICLPPPHPPRPPARLRRPFERRLQSVHRNSFVRGGTQEHYSTAFVEGKKVSFCFFVCMR